MITAGYFGRHVVIYPISTQYEDQGKALLNWNTNVKTAEDQPMSPQDWDHTARLEEALAPFAGYVFDFLDLPALIRGAKVIYQYPMVDRDPLPTWNFGNITLLGDAAHPMYPVGANGASQAIIDARVLARELAINQSVQAAVAAYDANRRSATAAVIQANRGLGPLEVLQIVERRAPDGFGNLDDIISKQELQSIAAAYKGTAGFDAELLNKRPSLSIPR
jgi:2-polyprenyl-6-methoxyphenol hydroxylase-like FAD-dependent oxidoreductase